MTYTQYNINDWSEYLDLGWLVHYDKVIMPQQDVNTAKPSDEGGKGYYELIGSSTNQNALKNFMSSGGTVQVHLPVLLTTMSTHRQQVRASCRLTCNSA